MQYKLRTIESREEWETFVRGIAPHTFLHSWNWGEFHAGMGEQVFRIGLYAGKVLSGVGMLVQVDARRGRFLLCPHGPLLAREADVHEGINVFVSEAIRIGRENGCHFVRIAPLLENDPSNRTVFRDLGFRDAPVHMVHPERAWILDLSPSEEELLYGMAKGARYSVRKAEKDGVRISMSDDPADVERFLRLYERTAQRQEFVPFSERYLRTEADIFCRDKEGAFFFAEHGGEVLSGAFIVFTDSSAFYHHGASVKKAGITAPHLLQWEAMREAKRRGCSLYNFWGVAPENARSHPWTGLSFFKKSFGGFAEEYVHAQDFPLSPRYWLAYAVERARRVRRGL